MSAIFSFRRASRSARLTSAGAIGIFLLLVSVAPQETNAHNNPTFREDLLLSIPVNTGTPPSSDVFSIQWPKKSVQLIWRVSDSKLAAQVSFHLFQDGKTIAEGLIHDSTTQRFKGDGFHIQSATGESVAFEVQLFAKVLDRSKKKN